MYTSQPGVRIVSGEAVALELPHAGLGTRTFAALIDYALQWVVFFILLTITLSAGGDDAAIAAAVVVELVLVFAGYPILFQWLGRGRTIGKLCLGLRAVRDDGGPLSFRQAVILGLTGLVLEKPGLLPPLSTAVGMIAIGTSKSSKRIGDHLAGTFVLNERVGSRAEVLVPPMYQIPWALQGWAAALDLTRLDDGLALSVRQFVTRANALTPAARYALETQLANQVMAVIAPPPPAPIPASVLLVTVLAERRRRADQRFYR